MEDGRPDSFVQCHAIHAQIVAFSRSFAVGASWERLKAREMNAWQRMRFRLKFIDRRKVRVYAVRPRRDETLQILPGNCAR